MQSVSGVWWSVESLSGSDIAAKKQQKQEKKKQNCFKYLEFISEFLLTC